MDEHNPYLMVVSEANFKGKKTNLEKDFPECKLEANFMSSMTKSRLIAMIKRHLNYKEFINMKKKT